MPILKNILFLCVSLAWLSAVSYADGIAVGGRVSTLGLGAELTVGLLPNMNGRLGINKFTYNHEATESGVEYDMDLNLDSWNALLDLYLLSSFHLTGGILINNNALDVEANLESGQRYGIGDESFSSRQIGEMSGSVDFEDTAWYLGLGWGNPVSKGGLFSIQLDLGIVLHGAPQVSLNSRNGTLSNNAFFQQNLRKEEAEIEDSMDSFEYYPVVSLGFAVQF